MRSTSSASNWITLAYFDQTNYEWEIRSAVVQAVDSAGITLKTDDGTARVTVSDSGAVDVVGTLTAARGVGDTLTDASNTGSVTLDFSATQNFVLTLTGNVTLANPTTETVGQSGFIVSQSRSNAATMYGTISVVDAALDNVKPAPLAVS